MPVYMYGMELSAEKHGYSSRIDSGGLCVASRVNACVSSIGSFIVERPSDPLFTPLIIGPNVWSFQLL